METNPPTNRSRIPRDSNQIRGAIKITDDSPMVRKTSLPSPPCSRQTDLFFGSENVVERPDESLERELVAISICGTCPYRVRCLSMALSKSQYDDRSGVQGGYTPKGRRAIRKWIWAQRPNRQRLVINLELFYNIAQFEKRKERVAVTIKFLQDKCKQGYK
jgi:hypothetical protein